MGRKCSELYIRRNQRISIEKVKAVYNYDEEQSLPTEEACIEFAEKLGMSTENLDYDYITSLFMEAYPDEISIHCMNGYYVIENREISFEGIAKHARSISRKLRAHILFRSIYDDDIYVFGTALNGKLIAEYVGGECDVYDEKQKMNNMEGFASFFECDPQLFQNIGNKNQNEAEEFEHLILSLLNTEQSEAKG